MQEAFYSFIQSRKLDPSLSENIFNIAQIYLCQRMVTEAVNLFKLLLQIDPQDVEVHRQIE